MATPVGPPLHPKLGRQPPGTVHAGRGGLVKTVQAAPSGEAGTPNLPAHGTCRGQPGTNINEIETVPLTAALPVAPTDFLGDG